MTKDEFNVDIWQFYLQLESDFYNTLRYVEFSEGNYSTYSKEYVRQLLSIGSEIDIACKELCRAVNPDANRGNINDYATVLCVYDNLPQAKVIFNQTKQEFTPFNAWAPGNSPDWWRAYNAVKHHRTEDNNEQKGNLQNVFMALAGLFVLNRYLCKHICSGLVMNEPEESSKLFKMANWAVSKPAGNGFNWVARTNGNLDLVYEGN